MRSRPSIVDELPGVSAIAATVATHANLPMIVTIAGLQTCTSRAHWSICVHCSAISVRPETSFRTGDDVLPRSGDVIHVTKAASVQFATPMLFRVIRVHDWPTYEGWIWLDGYELNSSGDAVERRAIFVPGGGPRGGGEGPHPRAPHARPARVAAGQGPAPAPPPDPRARNARQPGMVSGTVPARALRTNR